MKIGKPFKDFKNAPYPTGSITQYFGENPILYGQVCPITTPVKQCLVGHNGMDFVAPYGTPLFAVRGGQVFEVKDSPDGYGKHVRILSDIDGQSFYEWTYGHLSTITVKKGQIIKEGEIIGTMGNTGFVVSSSNANGFWKYNPYAGTHLHLGCRKYTDGVCQDYKNGYFGSFDYKDWLPSFDPINDDISGFIAQTRKLLIILQNAGILAYKPK